MRTLYAFIIPAGTALSNDDVGATLRHDATITCDESDAWLLRAALNLPGVDTGIGQAFEAMQAAQVYARVVRASDGSVAETVFPSLSEAMLHAGDRPEKTAMPIADQQADRTTPSPDRTADAPAVAPETQPAAQLPAPLSHRGR